MSSKTKRVKMHISLKGGALKRGPWPEILKGAPYGKRAQLIWVICQTKSIIVLFFCKELRNWVIDQLLLTLRKNINGQVELHHHEPHHVEN